MAVYTVKVKARPRPTKTFVRRRLTGKARYLANAVKKYLTLALKFDILRASGSQDVTAESLIFRGDTDTQDMIVDLIEKANDALSSQLKIVRSR